MLWIIVLLVLLVLSIAAFIHWINYGGIIGLWFANDMMNVIGTIISAIIEAIANMRD